MSGGFAGSERIVGEALAYRTAQAEAAREHQQKMQAQNAAPNGHYVGDVNVQTEMARWRGAVGELADRTCNLSSNLRSLGDELFGEMPPTPTQSVDAPTPPVMGQVGALEEHITRLSQNLAWAEQMFARLRRLA